jgi:hypothetical protein
MALNVTAKGSLTSNAKAVEEVYKSRRARVKRPRSAVTSGRRQFINGNPNSAWSRRYHDLIIAHAQDAGGRATLSEAQYSLCRRAAGLECEIERMEAGLSRGDEVDLDRYGRASSHLRRILESLGLERKAKSVNTIEADDADVDKLLSFFEPDNEPVVAAK